MVKLAFQSICLILFFLFACVCTQAQDTTLTALKPTQSIKQDTLVPQKKEKPSVFGNIFKKKDSTGVTQSKSKLPVVIAARKAAMRSLIVPGFGQVTNIMAIKEDKERLALQGKSFALKKIFISSKIAGIYIAESLLVYSFFSNKKDIRDFNAELNYRNQNGGAATTNGIYKDIQTSVIQAAKSNAIRNRDVSTFGFIAVHALNVIDAYIDARLRFFDVSDDLSFKITPNIIQQNAGGFLGQIQFYPALKLTLKL